MKDDWKTLLDEQHRSLCGLLQALEGADREVRETLAVSFRAELRAYFQSLTDDLFPALEQLSPSFRSRLDGLRGEHRAWQEHFESVRLHGQPLQAARSALARFLAHERVTVESMIGAQRAQSGEDRL